MAVYTEVSDEDLTEFAAGFGVGEVLSCKGIAEGIENTNYLVETESGRFILTLYEKRVKREDLPFYLGLMEHLSGKGIPCATPLKTEDGKTLHELCGRPAALVTFLPGMWPKRPTPVHCAGLGEALARFHLAGSDFGLTRPNDLSISGWRPLLEASLDHADSVRPGLAGDLAEELEFLEAHWPEGLPAGVIHADLFPDNVFFRGETLSGLIDFYFACNDIFAYDIAVCLNAWCFEADRSFNITKAKRMLRAYGTVRNFSEAELAALPILARGSALRFLLTRLYDWVHTPKDALVSPKDPLEFFDKLRFHQGVRGPGAYGLE
ncbi:MAG: homoserine kinase [Rhodospirillales bacterium]|nr:homoserine kinase [Rhodospirillales bacterium]